MATRVPDDEGESLPEAGPSSTLTTHEVAARLDRADIILTHGAGVASRAIRRFTRSHWNHAALVFVLSDSASGGAEGYQRTFIVEAESHGVDIHPIDKYLYNESQDMLVLRFPDFALPPKRRPDFLRRVRGFALEEIDAAYGYGTILRIGERILGPVGWLLKQVVRGIKVAGSTNRERAINSFVCGGVVQYAYYRACFGKRPVVDDPWDPFFADGENRRRLVVNAGMRSDFDPQEPFDSLAERLKLTIPADFSRAVSEEWLECLGERVDGIWRKQPTRV
jgi:hypothetical protein